MTISLERIFTMLVERSLFALWVVAAVLVLRFALQKAPKWTRCILWALVALRLTFSFNIESGLSLQPQDTRELAEALTGYSRTVVSANVAQRGTKSVLQDDDGNGYAFSEPGEYAAMYRNGDASVLTTILSRAWLVGMSAMFAYTAYSYVSLRRRVAASVTMDGEDIRSVETRFCDGLDTAFILGVAHPRVYLPSGMEAPQRELVLAHERAHLARRDHWWKPLGFLLLSVYWFNPALWLAYALFCRDIELACDERVLRSLGEETKKSYAEALLACSLPRRMVSACPVAFGETGVKERVRAVLNYRKPAFWAVAVAAVACVAVAVCFLTNPAEKRDLSRLNYEKPIAQLEPKEVRTEEPTPVRVWVDHYGEGTIWNAEALPLTLPELPDVRFAYTPGEIRIETMSGGNKLSYIMPGMPVWNAFFTDLTGDGVPELCATVNFGSGMVDEHIEAFDAVAWKHYALWERGEYDYALSAENDALIVHRRPYNGWEEETKGTLVLSNGRLIFAGSERLYSERFTNLMGFDGYCRDEELVPHHYLRSYLTEVNGVARPLAESFGFEADDHIVDLDGDGMTELVCNCVYGGDGAQRVYVYRRNGDTVERGSIDYGRLNLTAWHDWGVTSTAERYDTASGKIVVEYASLASSTMSRTFIVEAGYDALVWEEYADLGAGAVEAD